MSTFKHISKELKNYLVKELNYEKISPKLFQLRVDNIATQLAFQESKFDDSFYVNVLQGIYLDNNFIPILTARLSPYAVGSNIDFSWQNNDQIYLLSQLLVSIENNLINWQKVFFQAHNLLRVINRWKFSIEENIKSSLSSDLYNDVFTTLNAKEFLNHYNQLTDFLKSEQYKLHYSDNHIYFYKKVGTIWDVIYLQIIGFGTFLTVSVANWHPLFQVSDGDSQTLLKKTPADFENLMLLYYKFIDSKNPLLPSIPLFIGNTEIQHIFEMESLIISMIQERADKVLAQVYDSKTLLEATPIEYKNISYFKEDFNIIDSLNLIKNLACD